MENISEKLLGKCWFIYRRPAIAQLILEQIRDDTRRVVSSECALMDLVPVKNTMRRSQSTPNLKRKCS